jgi:uncharacterized protein YndB with AHSA1/START domain
MTQRTTVHASFTLERLYPHSPKQVFAAWSDKRAKCRWFSGAAEPAPDYVFEFRVGGREAIAGGPQAGARYEYEATYHDIVPDERIVYANSMDADGVRVSVSVTSVEFRPEGAGTRLVLTEHGIYLDGGDQPEGRERGVASQLDALTDALAGP